MRVRQNPVTLMSMHEIHRARAMVSVDARDARGRRPYSSAAGRVPTPAAHLRCGQATAWFKALRTGPGLPWAAPDPCDQVSALSIAKGLAGPARRRVIKLDDNAGRDTCFTSRFGAACRPRLPSIVPHSAHAHPGPWQFLIARRPRDQCFVMFPAVESAGWLVGDSSRMR